jgi:hypothetical protein
MTVATLPPINLVGGVTLNPLAAGGWQDNQVAYAVLYNTTQYPVTLNTGSGPKLVPALSAQMVATDGLGLTISTTNPLPSSGLTGLGVVTLAIYDESEGEPEGFPITLTTGAADYQLAVGYQPPSGGTYYLIPPGFNAFVITGPPGTNYTLIGAETGVNYNGILPTTGGGSGNSEADVLIAYPDQIIQFYATAPVNLYATLAEIPPTPSQLIDQGPYGMSLTAYGSVSFVPSPMGPAFGQAAAMGTSAGGYQGGNLLTPVGRTPTQGAISSSIGAWNLDIIFTPTAPDIASIKSTILSRYGTPGNEWVLNLVSGVPNFTYYDSGYAAHTLVGSLCTAGVPCQLTITWNGTNWYLVQAGTLKATLVGGTVITPAVQAMIIGWNVATYSPGLLGPIDEVRISYLNRLYTYPTTGPLVKDVYTQCLYEFDITPPVNTGQAPVYTVTVPNPAGGSDWTYTLLTPARLLAVNMNFVGAPGGAAFSRLIIRNAGVGLWTGILAPSIAANQQANLNAAVGAPFASVSESATYLDAMAPLPNLMLPAGATIGTSTEGTTAGMQYNYITLTFSAD